MISIELTVNLLKIDQFTNFLGNDVRHDLFVFFNLKNCVTIRSTNQDYKGSGFDRGHLAAAGNHRISQKHIDETFFLTNIAPQVGAGFNRDIWNDLEKYVRKLARIHRNVYICTGPLYLPR